MNRRFVLFGFCALLLWPPFLPAADQARIPYELIYQIQKTETSLGQSFTNLYMFLGMTSTLPGVGIPDLVVYIDSKDKRMPVELNPTNGGFSVPMRDSLVTEQAWIVVNQPKGTMNLEWYVGLKVGKVPGNNVRYGELMRPLKDLEVIRGEMKKIPGSPDLGILGLKLFYPLEKEASVIIHAKAGDRVFKTSPSHTLVIPWEPALLAEDPMVSIPILPEKVDVANPSGEKGP